MIRTPEARETRARYQALLRDERKAREKAKPARVEKVGQEPRKQEPKYRQWIRRLQCVACEAIGYPQGTRTEAAHVRYADAAAGWKEPGMQRKPDDRRTVPLCAGHHQFFKDAQHKHGERRWWEERRISPPALCAALSACFDANGDGPEVIRQFANASRKS